MAANPEIKAANLELRREHPGLTPEALEPVYYRTAFRSIASDPVRSVALLAQKAYYLAVPTGPSYTLHSARYRLGSVVPYVMLLPLAIGGAWTLIRRKAGVTVLGLMFASAILTCLLFFPQERFRIPVIDPTLVICAAVWTTRKRTSGGETAHSS